MANNDKSNIGQSLDLHSGESTEQIKANLVKEILYKSYAHNPIPHEEELAAMRKNIAKREVRKQKKNPDYVPMTEKEQELEVKSLEDFTEERMNKKIESALKKLLKRPESDNFKPLESKISATQLIGPPGHGKTTTFKEAAKEVAKLLGLNYRENIADDTNVTITKRDFVFVSMEMSGENSAVVVGGIPTKVDTPDGRAYMAKLVSKRIAMAKDGSAGIFLLDDFTNAGASVQNVGLAITEEGRFQGLGLGRLYVGLTGNLGALDGTHTTKQSAAIRGRVKSYYVEDKLDDFINRVQQRFTDEFGDTMILGFLRNNPNFFTSMPDPKKSGGFAAPRNWEKAIIESRQETQLNGGIGNNLDYLMKIKRLAIQFTGTEAGYEYAKHVDAYIEGPLNLAQTVVNTSIEKLKEGFKKMYASKATNAQFNSQYAMAIGDETVIAILNDLGSAKKLEELDKEAEKNLKRIITKFAIGISELSGGEFGFAVDYMKDKLANQAVNFSTKNDSAVSKRTLGNELVSFITETIKADPDVSKEQKTLLDKKMMLKRI